MADSKVVRGRPPHAQQVAVEGDAAVGLASATDQLNQTFTKVERRLKPFGVGAAVILPISGRYERETHRLEFGKHGGTWRLLYVVGSPGEFGEDTEEVPLVTAPRFVRLAAAAKIKDLVDAVRSKAMDELQSVRSAIAAVEAALAELPEPPTGDFGADDFGDVPF